MPDHKDEITLSTRLFVEHGKAIEAVLRSGICQTLVMHKRLGHSIAVWQDGKVVIIPPRRSSFWTNS